MIQSAKDLPTMPAISLASADSRQMVDDEALPAPGLGYGRAPSRAALWPDAARMGLRRAFRPLAIWLRGGWLYRQTFSGPVPDRIYFYPDDPRTRRLDDADAFMRGRFRFAGQSLEVREGSIFDQPPPSKSFAAALHGFDWLRHLELAGGDLARQFALKVTQQWVKRYGRFVSFPWQPEIIAERFLNLFAHAQFFLNNPDLAWRSRLFVSLRDQARVLERTIGEAPDGLPRLKSAAALALAGLCLSDARSAAVGLKRLAHEIERQILPDGGHVSRSPEALLEAFRVLGMVQQVLDSANREVQPVLRGALDRMAPMLRFFRLGDGALAVFHGGGETDAPTIAVVLEHDQAAGRPLGHAPHTGFQRLAVGRTLILFDVGGAPRGPFSVAAHAGCLAFEMSAGTHRMIINCGAGIADTPPWVSALRSTPAHSTLTIEDASSATILSDGVLANLLGPLLIDGPAGIETRRSENPQGPTADANHDGYLSRFGFVHQRCMTLSSRGLKLTGVDRLIPAGIEAGRGKGRARRLPFAIRFHVHPDVRLSLAQGGVSVILKLPNGEGWRFRCGGLLAIEESIYLGSGSARRAEQLVVNGELCDEPIECAWLFEQVGSA
jgi:uncharacterized heparinase superfamily protein